ncbi:UNVERIFIED_CONTAM: hypothetical protein Slati_2349200 [Sesamum latifolium]|uniref:Uncharacterized protein n=1 Tax=Sesamum latifolium TaxID=2727402 RepID=A0AAW2WEF3_9LAMI
MVAHRFRTSHARLVVSAAEKGRCSTFGLSWLHHRNRQDFPDRPFMYLLIRDQFRARIAPLTGSGSYPPPRSTDPLSAPTCAHSCSPTTKTTPTMYPRKKNSPTNTY